MTEGAQDVFAQALALSPEDRAALIEMLAESLCAPEHELSPAWKAEIVRRIEAVERGESQLIPADEVEARVLASLGGA
jgi:putative addiction module component (TIGR02574 family)